MAIVPGFDYDIFVSYAHTDDLVDAAEGPGGWVFRLVNLLERYLRQQLGGHQDLKIFRDRSETTSSSRVSDFPDLAKRSALFLAVGSPSFVHQEWTLKELAGFVEKNSDLSRLFLIECHPLGRNLNYPPPLDDNVRLEFWKPWGDNKIPKPLSAQEDREVYSGLVRRLAKEMGDKLEDMKLRPGRSTVASPGQNAPTSTKFNASESWNRPTQPRKSVILAQSTEDVEDETDQIRDFLRQYDEATVLPVSVYPQGGDAFKAAFSADLARADLFVQLLGKRIGRMPPDLPDGYTRFQLQAARNANVPVLQWRHPDLNPDAVADPVYKAILKAETVVASGLEAFKQYLLREIRKEKAAPRRPKHSMVFINADDKDLGIAKEVERECLQNELTTILPVGGSSAEEARIDLEENLIDCDVLVFIYGDTSLNWIRGQLKRYFKMRPRRESDPKLTLICSGPTPKPDIGITFPDAHLIKCPEGWNLEPIRKLLSEIRE
jgi:hypothetical protein